MDRSKWEYKKLGEVAQYPKNRLGSEFLDIDNYVGVENLLKDKGGRINALSLPTNTSTIEYKENDILIGNIRPYLKKIWFADRHGGASGDVVNIRVKENYRDRINPKFLYCVLSTDAFFTFDMAHSKGAKMPRGNKDDIVKYSIPLPPVADQQRIVAELDCLNEMIALKQEQLKEFDKLAQSIFYDMFGDPITNEKGWRVDVLNSVCDVRDGTHDSPKYVEDGYPLITSKNVVEGGISFDDVNYISEDDLNAINARSRVDDGDIIMPMIGTIGKPVIVHKDREFAIKNVALIKFEMSKVVLNIFIQSLLNSSTYSNYILSLNRGGTQKFVSLKTIRNLPIILPPLALQQQFAEKIQAIEAQKELVKQSIAETQHLLDSRMDYYFN